MNSEEKIKIEFNKKIQSEVEEFRKRMTNESPEYVYSACEKVCFIETLYDMLFCTNIASDAKENISFDAIKWLNKKEKPLEFLHQEFEKKQYAFSKNWDELIDIIEVLFYLYKKETTRGKFLKTIDNEIKEFRENYASFLSPEAVYKDYYIIFFIESYFNMFFSTADEISEDVICWLNKQKNPLEFLYGKWLSCDGNFSESWEDMSNWVKQLFNEEKAENI